MKQTLLLLAIGLVGCGMAVAIGGYGGLPVTRARIAVSDWFMVRDDGPRLGRTAVRPEIVLVLFDYRTAAELGYVHSFTDDAQVYKKLLEQGAKVVYDTRVAAAATPDAFEELEPFLNEILALDDTGRVMRDIWLSASLFEGRDQFRPLISQNIINSHPHALPDYGSRLYPLLCFMNAIPTEAAPLAICRRFWDLEPIDSVELGEEMRRSGMMAVWHQHSPEFVPENSQPSQPQSAYRLGEFGIPWYPFDSSTPLVPPIAFWVSYDPPLADYPRYSYLDVLRDKDVIDLQDKIVLIGFSADIDPGSDTYSIPSLNGKAASAEVLACATQTILEKRGIVTIPFLPATLLIAAMTVGFAFITGMLRPVQAALAVAGGLLLYYGLAVALYRHGWYADFLIAPLAAVGTGVAGGTLSAWNSLRSRQRVIDLFGRYVPRAIVNQLILRSELESLALGGVKREVSVLFADIRGFTDFSQDLPPEDVVRELNALLEIMVACTFENEGTLDKFIGDAILVLFNAPLDQPDHARRAVRTAVDIQQRLVGHASGLRVGIGVHQGEAVVGNIGTPQRMEYTAIGSTVNIASRLCDYAQPGDVVVSQAVLANLPDDFDTESLGTIQVKGIKLPLEVARVVGPRTSHRTT